MINFEWEGGYIEDSQRIYHPRVVLKNEKAFQTVSIPEI